MNPVARFYEHYWQDPEHAAPVGDVDAKSRLTIIERALEKITVHRILNVGCGRGDFAAKLMAAGYGVEGMELAPAAIEAAGRLHPTLPVIQHSIEDTPWPYATGSFGAVTTLEVIEHLLDPRPLFREAARVLQPHGLMFVSTPFHGLIKNIILCITRFDHHFCNLESGHIRFFTDRRIAQLATQHGFTVQSIHHYGRWWPIWRGLLLVARRNVL